MALSVGELPGSKKRNRESSKKSSKNHPETVYNITRDNAQITFRNGYFLISHIYLVTFCTLTLCRSQLTVIEIVMFAFYESAYAIVT